MSKGTVTINLRSDETAMLCKVSFGGYGQYSENVRTPNAIATRVLL
jgi:hypothetical protein